MRTKYTYVVIEPKPSKDVYYPEDWVCHTRWRLKAWLYALWLTIRGKKFRIIKIDWTEIVARWV